MFFYVNEWGVIEDGYRLWGGVEKGDLIDVDVDW